MARQSPLDGRTLALLGARLAAVGDYREAARRFEQAIRAGNLDDAVWRGWAASRAAMGDSEGAKKALELGLQPAGPTDKAALTAAWNTLKALPGDVSPLKKAAAVSPDGPPHLIERYGSGGIFNKMSDYLASRRPEISGLPYREKFAADHPGDLTAQLLLADGLRRMRRLNEAEALAKKAVDGNPKSPEAHKTYGDILFEGGAITKAGVQYKAALDLRPRWLPALIGFGNVGVEKKFIQIALNCFQEATKQAPNNADAWIGLGGAYLNQDMRIDEAIKAFEKAKALTPERTDYFAHFSDALRARYRFDEAESLLRQRLADSPDDARVHYLLAIALLDDKQSQERTKEAEAHLRKSIAIQPNAPVARIRLARILLDKGTPDDAADAGLLLTESLEANPNEPEALRLLIRAYQGIGNPAKAKSTQVELLRVTQFVEKMRSLEENETSHPYDMAVHEALARTYDEAGRTDEAQRQREIAFMLKNYPAKAKRGLKALIDATSTFSAEEAPEKR